MLIIVTNLLPAGHRREWQSWHREECAASSCRTWNRSGWREQLRKPPFAAELIHRVDEKSHKLIDYHLSLLSSRSLHAVVKENVAEEENYCEIFKENSETSATRSNPGFLHQHSGYWGPASFDKEIWWNSRKSKPGRVVFVYSEYGFQHLLDFFSIFMPHGGTAHDSVGWLDM